MTPPSTRHTHQRTRHHPLYLILLLCSHILLFCFAFFKLQIWRSHPLYKTLQCLSPILIKTKILSMTNKVLHGPTSVSLSSLVSQHSPLLYGIESYHLLFKYLTLPTAVRPQWVQFLTTACTSHLPCTLFSSHRLVTSPCTFKHHSSGTMQSKLETKTFTSEYNYIAVFLTNLG